MRVIEYSGGSLRAERGEEDERESSIDERRSGLRGELTDGCKATSSLVPVLPTKLSTLYTKRF